MYMAAGRAAAIADKLIVNGLPADMPVVIVENASLPEMATTATTLGALRSMTENMTHGGPALLMIGRVFQRAEAQTTVVDRVAVREVVTA
jgi:uroporphyrin-III C-methyltransferase